MFRSTDKKAALTAACQRQKSGAISDDVRRFILRI
jgi:hypothetical protein